MPQVELSELRQRVSFSRARVIVDAYCNDTESYSDEQVRIKNGVCKQIAEEFVPTYLLAEKLCFVRDIRLYPDSNPGPDAEIRFFWRTSYKVQITCANEGYQRSLLREALMDGPQFEGQVRTRKRQTGEIELDQARAMRPPNAVIEDRVDRLRSAIEHKVANYYDGTDTLLVQDDSDQFIYLGDLSNRIVRLVSSGLGAPYKRIFAQFGGVVKKLK